MEIPPGKVPVAVLREALSGFPDLPAEVLVGPAAGEDAAAVQVDAGVLIAATDPITLTAASIGAFAVEINANDVAVMGARPRWFLAAILLPTGSSVRDVHEILDAMRPVLERLGVALVGGHTEVTGAVNQPLVVGQMLGLLTGRAPVTTGGAGHGDVLVQVGEVPVEGAAVLADAAEAAGEVDDATLRAARAATDDPGISVVEAALLAADLGATAMHDPTEGGLAAGLHELASAGDVAIVVERSSVSWFAPGRAVCSAVGADPWATLASGCLLATFPADRSEAVRAALTSAGHTAVVIGEVEAGEGVRDGSGGTLPWPERDEVARISG